MVFVFADLSLRGFIAGMLAGAVMAATNIVLVHLNLSNLLYADWALMYVVGHIDQSLLGKIIGQLAHIFFTGIIGLLFARIVQDRNYYQLKGIIWSLVVWFSTNATPVLFQTEPLSNKDLKSTIAHSVTAIIYGWVLAEIISRIEKRRTN